MFKATQLVSIGVGISSGHLMTDPVFLTSKLYSFHMFLVLSLSTLAKACVDGNRRIQGNTESKAPTGKSATGGGVGCVVGSRAGIAGGTGVRGEAYSVPQIRA